MIIVDSHCDSLLKLVRNNTDISDISNDFNISNIKIRPHIQFMACFVPEKFKHFAYIWVLELISKYEQSINKYPDIIKILKKEDLFISQFINSVSTLLTIEGGEALQGDLKNLEKFYKMGVRALGLTWNNNNDISTGCNDISNTIGLSEFGRNVVHKMNDIGMIIDVSHISEKGFWDVIKETKKPIIASHSCCKSLCSHRKNLSDEQIKAISEKGGIIGVCFYGPTLITNRKSTIIDIINHIEYIIKIGGINCVGIGSDFDGMDDNDKPVDMNSVKDLEKLITGLDKKGYTDDEIENIMGKNMLKFLNDNL